MTLRQRLSNSQRYILLILIFLCVQVWWRYVYYTLYSNKMLSLPGSDEGNEKPQVAFDAWGRQESLLNAAERNGSADKMPFFYYFIIGSRSLCASVCPITVNSWMLLRLECHSICLSITTTGKVWKGACVDHHRGVYLALNLPGFGDGRQVTSSHHHGPRNTTHGWHLYVCISLLVLACVCVCVCLHDNLFACGLQHHVLGPFIPVLVGLWLVHDLLEHRPLPAQKQSNVFSLFISCYLQGISDTLANRFPCILHLLLNHPTLLILSTLFWTGGWGKLQ